MSVHYIGRQHFTHVVETDPGLYHWECDCGDESGSYEMYNFAHDAAVDHERSKNPR